jgi:hypothetical protein
MTGAMPANHPHLGSNPAGRLQRHPGLDERLLAAALRPILESFMRVVYPHDFPPGMLLGPLYRRLHPAKGNAGRDFVGHLYC